MKKIYKKPILIVESYQLDTGIASCSDGGIAINATAEDCNFDMGGLVYYANDTCYINPDSPNENGDTICYHGLNSGLNLPFFAS